MMTVMENFSAFKRTYTYQNMPEKLREACLGKKNNISKRGLHQNSADMDTKKSVGGKGGGFFCCMSTSAVIEP